jgi:hypothetical protein
MPHTMTIIDNDPQIPWHRRRIRGTGEPPGDRSVMAARRIRRAYHDRAVIACMNDHGFTTYGAAEAWLARHGEQWDR